MLGHFVIGFSGGVIACFSNERILRLLLHEEQARMAAGNDQRKGRVRNGLILIDIGRTYVGLDMVDGEKRNTSSISDCFAETKADEERSYQAGALGDRHGVDSAEIDACFPQSTIDNGPDVGQVLPGSDLRDHPSVGAVNGDLRNDEIGQDAPAVLDDGRRGLITGAFYSKNKHFQNSYSTAY